MKECLYSQNRRMVYIVTRSIHAQTGLCPLFVYETEEIPEAIQKDRISIWGSYTLSSPPENGYVWIRLYSVLQPIAMNTIEYIGGSKPDEKEGMKIMGPFALQ
jgi:hypothetical protein